MTKEKEKYLENNILDFPAFLAGTREADIEIGDLKSSMDSKIIQSILEYAKMEEDPRSMELHDHFDRETVNIAEAIICRYWRITNTSEGDELALLWANRKLGVGEDVCVPN